MMTLYDCVAGVESSHNPLALRFEPVMFQNRELWALRTIPKIIQANTGISQDTGLMLACSSFGKYQVLGANIYAQGYEKSIFAFVNSESDQDATFAGFIKPHGFNPLDDVSKWPAEKFSEFAAFYNGPANVADYAAAMQRQLP